MLIVQQLGTKRRSPAYAHDKVVSLGDISIYTEEEDKPLPEVFELIAGKTGLKPVDVKALGQDAEIREYFGSILPSFDRDRVYTTDIKKIFQWYNQLIAAGITKFTEEENTGDRGDAAADGAEASK